MNTPRLKPGTALVAVPGRGLALRTPDGTFLRVDTADVPEEDLLRLFGGGPLATPEPPPAAGPVPLPDAAPATRTAPTATEPEHTPASDRLLAAFEDAGYATRDPAPAGDRPLTGTTLLLLGDPVLTRPVARLVRAAGAEPVPTAADDLPTRAVAGARTAVVWCLDRPVPPGLWDRADRLSRDGVLWARCHREGAEAWLEPPASGPYGTTSADIRLRRLAATPAHRELAAYWAGSRTPDNGPRHTEASAACTAALLVHDLVTRLRLGPDRTPPVLRRIDLRDLTTTAHPVLPVPECAPLPAGRNTP
ncbi:hypothetical protein ACIQ9E_27020 [Streptomyces sp. NPDC094448]|uniref:hypothetical protein n=1 Tax=Streptomyces sp. NPDC094448 TaxID=3366063 RepID=UPI0038249CC6